MRILIIRHGRTQGNNERRYIGSRTDEPLLASEKEELVSFSLKTDASGAAYIEWLESNSSEIPGNPKQIVVVSSPMKRAVETAEIMFPSALLDIHLIDELREMDFGIFEGKTYEEMNADPDVCGKYQAWIDSGCRMKISDGESMAEFNARSSEGFRKAVRLATERRADALIITAHGGTVMSVMSSLFGGNYYDYYTGNGEGYTFEVEVDDAGNVTAAGPYDRFCGRVRA